MWLSSPRPPPQVLSPGNPCLTALPPPTHSGADGQGSGPLARASLKSRAVTAEATDALPGTQTPEAGRRGRLVEPRAVGACRSARSPREQPRPCAQSCAPGLTGLPEKRLHDANAVTRGPAHGCYLGTEPQLAGQVVVPDLLGELDAEVPGGAVLGDAQVHDLVDDVQHVVLQRTRRALQRGCGWGAGPQAPTWQHPHAGRAAATKV